MRNCFALLTLLFCLPLSAAQLHLEFGHTARQWQSEALLAHPQAQDISIEQDVSYKRPMHYRAVPLSALLEGWAPTIICKPSRWMASPPKCLPRPCSRPAPHGPGWPWKTRPNPGRRWATANRVPGRSTRCGPILAGNIRPEQWPFQITTIRRLAPVQERFPALLPDPTLAANDPVRQGFALFQQNCLACHRLNGAGDAQFGPDLNVPHNPTEYFQPGFCAATFVIRKAYGSGPRRKCQGLPKTC